MKTEYWMSLIRRVANDADEAALVSLAKHMAECERAKSILRNKGFGVQGLGIEATARLVPLARD